MSSALQALVARQEDRANWEKAIDQLQWCILNNPRVPPHERVSLLEKANILRKNPELSCMQAQKGFTFEQPFGKWIDELHWEAIKALSARLQNAQ